MEHMADTQNNHDIAKSIWNEFASELKNIGVKKADLEKLTALPTTGVEGGPSSHIGFDEAHANTVQSCFEGSQ
jgi:hypothetical protein